MSITLARGDVDLEGSVWEEAPSLLFLHAGGESRHVWGPVVSCAAMRAHRCVAFDLRGGGGVTGRVDRFATLVEDARAMVRLCGGRVVLVGASIGGLASIAALADPETTRRVEGLVLLDVVPDPRPERTRHWLDERGLRDLNPALIEEILRRGDERLVSVSRFDRPVALVRGTDGSPVTDEDVVRLRAACPQLETYEVAAGHLIARDAPEALAAIIAGIVEAWRTHCAADDEGRCR